MRRLLLALPFALLPLAIAQAAQSPDDHVEEHASLGTHEHGVGRLNAALDGTELELELENPSMNLVGFEHLATSAVDQATVAAARADLQKPLALFALPAAANCSVAKVQLHSPLFGDKADADDGDHDHEHEHEHEHDEHAKGDGDEHEHEHHHSEIHANYMLTCTEPSKLTSLDLAPLFKRFPSLHQVQAQLIGPAGQQGAELTEKSPRLNF